MLPRGGHNIFLARSRAKNVPPPYTNPFARPWNAFLQKLSVRQSKIEMLLEPAPPALFHWIKLIEILGGTSPDFPTLRWNYYNHGLT